MSLVDPGVHIKIINTGNKAAIYSIYNKIDTSAKNNAVNIKSGVPITVPLVNGKVCARGYFPSQ